MQAFNFKRFVNLMRWTIMNRIGEIAGLTVGLFMAFVFISIGVTGLFFQYNPERIKALNEVGDIGMLMLIIMLTGIAANYLKPMQTKQGSINLLMLPGTNLEKYLTTLLFCLVFGVVAFFVALVSADLVQWLISMFYYPANLQGSITKAVLSYLEVKPEAAIINVDNVTFPDNNNQLTSMIDWLWLISFFLLGGSLFRKKAWAKSSLVLIVLILSIGFSMVYFGDFGAEIGSYEFSYAIGRFVRLHTLTALILAIINLGLSYRIFTRLQVINNRWINW